jgi:hypothetical protein
MLQKELRYLNKAREQCTGFLSLCFLVELSGFTRIERGGMYAKFYLDDEILYKRPQPLHLGRGYAPQISFGFLAVVNGSDRTVSIIHPTAKPRVPFPHIEPTALPSNVPSRNPPSIVVPLVVLGVID